MKTFLKAFSTKLTLVMLAFASLATSAMAEVKLSFDDISLFIGKSTPVTVCMDNDEDGITNLQFDLTLPDNMTLDAASVAGTGRFSADQSVKVAKQGSGAYRFVIVSASSDGFSGNEGAILTFNVTATADPGAEAALTMDGIVAVKGTSKLQVSATPGAVTVLEDGVTFEADETDISIVDGAAQVGISMNNSMDLVGVQGVITLPDGLTLDADEPIVKSERISNLSVSFKPETGVFVVTSTDNSPISGNYGTLFTLNLKADATLAETSEITIASLVASTPQAQSLSAGDVITINVTNEEAVQPDPVVLNAPTWNAENGTQFEPYMLAAGTTLKITYTADNLEANGLNADDLQVKIMVLVSGDLPENTMNMQSATVHRVQGQTFYIPLGETDYPVELKEGYVYQSIAVLSATLVKPATDGNPEEVVATYAGAPAMLRWIGVPIGLDAAYERALEAIDDGNNYRIFTEVNGQKYYVTDAGKLTDAAADGGIFAFKKVTGGTYKEYGFKIDGGGKRFTNPPLNNNVAKLDNGVFATTTGDRNDWEAQVLFMFNDKYAIRSCNVPDGTSSWNDAGRTYWTYAVEEVAPLYTYDPTFVWQIEGPLTTINVTYQLYEEDGQTTVGNPVTKQQEANSEPSIPADFTTVAYYDYTAEGTIGEEDCTVKVIRTMKEGIVHALSDLSNEKAYTIRCDRGALLTQDGHVASTAHSSLGSAEPAEFAIISYENHYYLYSVADGQFMTFDPALQDEGSRGPLAYEPTHGTDDAIYFEPKTDPYFLTYFTTGGTNYGFNTNGNDPYGYVINTWMNADAGNQYYIIEAGDFDPTDALAALDEFFHPSPVKNFTVDVERYPALGYKPTVASIDLSEIKEHLGVDELTTDMLSIVNPDGQTISDYAPFDGWFNAEGVATAWGNTTAICVKFFQALPDGEFEICDMNGADEVGTTYTVTWQLHANEKTAQIQINVTFVEAPAPELEILKTVEAGSVEYSSTDDSYTLKTLTLTDEQVADILQTLGLESLDDAELYGWNPTSEEAVANFEGYDGWRDPLGDFASWTGNFEVPACVKYGPFDNPALDNKSFAIYNIKGSFSGDIKTYWAFANEDNQAVLVEIIFTVTASDAQELLEEEIFNATKLMIDADADDEAYDDDNQVFIDALNALQDAVDAAAQKLGTTDDEMFAATEALKEAEEAFMDALTGITGISDEQRTATIFDLSGRKVARTQRGIYIVNGKKVAVK